MADKRPVLITGGLGYLGTVIVPRLARTRPVVVYDTMMFGNSLAGTPNVTFIEGDIRKFDDFRAACAGIESVIHLAAVVTDDLVDKNPQLARSINVNALGRNMVAMYREGIKRFIYVSSSSVYGSHDEDCTEDSPTHPETEYAQQKLDGEEAAFYWADQIEVCAVRMATLCGPAPRMRLDTIVNIFSAQAYFNPPITVWGGDQYRCNLHVADAAEAYQRLLDHPTADDIRGKVFNLGGKNMAARDIGMDVAKVFDQPFDVDESKQDTRHYRMDSSRIQRVLKWTPKGTIESAARQNKEFFAAGGVTEPDNPIYRNTERMREFMTGGG